MVNLPPPYYCLISNLYFNKVMAITPADHDLLSSHLLNQISTLELLCYQRFLQFTCCTDIFNHNVLAHFIPLLNESSYLTLVEFPRQSHSLRSLLKPGNRPGCMTTCESILVHCISAHPSCMDIESDAYFERPGLVG